MVAEAAVRSNPLQAAEHIVLESDTREVPQLRSLRGAHASLQCRSRLRRRSLNLAAAPREYVLDLRFIDPSFALMRHILWRCICAALALTAAVAACAMWCAAATALRWRHLARHTGEARSLRAC